MNMARKGDPFFNVEFVKQVQKYPCLWKNNHTGYNKKEETHKAWQAISSQHGDTIQANRDRWRTIRSSFLRSLKDTRKSSGRKKRKYYLSPYLEFLIPYTKTRLSRAASTRDVESPMTPPRSETPPTTQNSNKTSAGSVPQAVEDNQESSSASSDSDSVAMQEESAVVLLPLQKIKTEPDCSTDSCSATRPTVLNLKHPSIIAKNAANSFSGSRTTCVSVPLTNEMLREVQQQHHQQQQQQQNQHHQQLQLQRQHHRQDVVHKSNDSDWVNFTEWFAKQHDSDQSFLNSLLPFLKKMSDTQNLCFREKVIRLINNILVENSTSVRQM